MTYRVWAPLARERVTLVLADERHPMSSAAGGWWESDRLAVPGTSYAFALDDGEPRPDPRAIALPDGPEGASEVVDLQGDGLVDPARPMCRPACWRPVRRFS